MIPKLLSLLLSLSYSLQTLEQSMSDTSYLFTSYTTFWQRLACYVTKKKIPSQFF